ncbi:MAG: hypothetical protein JNL70_24745 [Saprospiraceae bacterium]|nr:hypothetical protein [Saprospiraceae bacterium]
MNHRISKVALLVTVWCTMMLQLQAQPIVLSPQEQQLDEPNKQKLITTRKLITDKKLTFTVGINGVSNRSLKQLTGEKQLSAAEEQNFSQRIQSHIQMIRTQNTVINPTNASEGASTNGNTSMRRFDLRTTSNSTPIKDQNPFGTCWAFGAVSAYESNYRVTNTKTIDASEQQVINCSGAGDENGGFALDVFKWMVDKSRNLENETVTPYQGTKMACGGTPATPYHARAYGVVDPSGNPSRIASVAAIKQALVRYGAISASVDATDAFQMYNGGVFNEYPSNPNNPSTNHAITIIGWDDDRQAWIMKNSWGTNWGITCDFGTERGYMYINYNANNIGRRAAWILTNSVSSTSAAKSIASVSRAKGTMENWWVDNNGTIQAAYFYDGRFWNRYQLGQPGGAAPKGGIAALSRASNTMEVWWIGANGSVQGAYWYEGSEWKYYELAPAGSAATTASIAAVSRAKGTMELWWTAPNGSVQAAFWYEGSPWKRYELAPANSSATTGGITAVSRATGTMEVWWIGANGSVQAAFWYEGNPWKRYELAPANFASTIGGITVVSRASNTMELWYIGSNGSVKGVYWYEGGSWKGYDLAPAGSAELGSGIDAVSRIKTSMELWYVGAGGSLEGKYWYEGGNWTGYRLANAGTLSKTSGISVVSRFPGTLEFWYVGNAGNLLGSFWYENSTWKSYELAEPRSSFSSNFNNPNMRTTRIKLN